MTERDEAGRYAALTSAQRLKAQIEGQKPTTHANVTVENGAQTRARIEKQLGIERRPAAEKPRGSEDAETGIRRMFDDRTRGRRVDVTERGANR